MRLLSEADRQRIERAIAEAETRTTGEFVAVVTEESDDYLFIPTLAAACLALALSGLALLVQGPLSLSFGLTEFYTAQVLTFLALVIVFRWPPLKLSLVPKRVKEERARRLAHQLFIDLGLSSTRQRTGAMLFVSAAEHYVEIIVDRGIRERVDDAVWEGIITAFVADVRAGRIGDGFVRAIEATTAVIGEHFPWHPEDTNELPNRLVVI